MSFIICVGRLSGPQDLFGSRLFRAWRTSRSLTIMCLSSGGLRESWVVGGTRESFMSSRNWVAKWPLSRLALWKSSVRVVPSGSTRDGNVLSCVLPYECLECLVCCYECL